MNHYGNGYPPGNPPPRLQPQLGGYPQQQAQQPYGQQPASPYGQQQAAPHAYGQPQPPHGYGQPVPQPMQHPQQPQHQPPPQQQHQQQQTFHMPGLSVGVGGFNVGIPGVGGLGSVNTAGLSKRANTMSPVMVFVFFAAAIAIGFLFDVVFTFVHVPFGRYIWYATTILPFAAAGMLGALWTKSGKPMVIAVAVVASLIYGVCDIGLGVALGGTEGGISMAYILNLAAFSIGISVAGGIGGAIKGAKQKESLAPAPMSAPQTQPAQAYAPMGYPR